MRELVRRHKGDEQRIISAYAEAEERGEVVRESNRHNIPAREYAIRLFSDGRRKGWISE